MTTNLTIGAVGTFFALIGGLLADRFGVKTLAVLPRLAVTVLMFPALQLIVSSGSAAALILVMGALMTLHAMASAAAIILIPKIFPAAVRTSGLSIAYALGVTIFGGTAQLVFTAIIAATGNKLSWVWYIVAMNVLCLVATMAIKVPREWAIKPAAVPGALVGALE
jgi:nitrate/nitrite transporter NarK